MTVADVSIGSIFIWKHGVLKEVARAFASDEMRDIQKKTGVWTHGAEISYPAEKDIKVIENGCLIFKQKIGTVDILFSVWMQPGEVRMGIKIPNSFISNPVNRSRISKVYDGEDCPRTVLLGEHTLFDWIWTDGFADYDRMAESVTNDILASLLAERMVQILTHLYLAVFHEVLDLAKLRVHEGQVISGKMDQWEAHVRGDFEAFAWLIRNYGVIEDSRASTLFDKAMQVVFLYPVDKRATISGLQGRPVKDGENECFISKVSAIKLMQA